MKDYKLLKLISTFVVTLCLATSAFAYYGYGGYHSYRHSGWQNGVYIGIGTTHYRTLKCRWVYGHRTAYGYVYRHKVCWY